MSVRDFGGEPLTCSDVYRMRKDGAAVSHLLRLSQTQPFFVPRGALAIPNESVRRGLTQFSPDPVPCGSNPRQYRGG